MSLESELHSLDGITPNSVLFKRGYSVYDLRQGISTGRLIRPRKGWVALPGADSQLLFAAQHNVVVSCITQASRLNLWVLAHDRPHVAGSLTRRHTTAPNCTVHWRQPLVPRRPGLLVDHIENVLDTVAACQPHDTALAIWDSALQKKLTDYQSLAALPLSPRGRVLLSECTPFSDSGLESMFRTRLRWLNLPIRTQIHLCGHRVDFLIGDRLVVQIDGKQHSGAQRASDMAHDAELVQRGYTVIRVNYAQVVYEWADVEARVLGAVARGRHVAGR